MFGLPAQTNRVKRKSNDDRWLYRSCILAFVLALALLAGLLVQATGIPDSSSELVLF
jgi:hypothetical protein